MPRHGQDAGHATCPGRSSAANAGGAPGDLVRAGAAGDEVAGEEDEVGVERVDLRDHFLEEPRLGVLGEVDVGDLDDAVVEEGVRQVADGDGAVVDDVLVASGESGVEPEASSGEGRSGEEGAAGQRHAGADALERLLGIVWVLS